MGIIFVSLQMIRLFIYIIIKMMHTSKMVSIIGLLDNYGKYQFILSNVYYYYFCIAVGIQFE